MRYLLSSIIFLFFSFTLYSDNFTDFNLPINSIKTNNVSDPDIGMGNELFFNGNYNGAVRYYEKAINKKEIIAFYNLGVTNYVLGNYDKAVKDFSKVLEIDKNNKDAQINLVSTYLMLGNIDEAEKIILPFLDKPDSVKVCVNAAYIFLKRGDTAHAYYYLSKAKEIAPDDLYVSIAYVNFLFSIGDAEKGLSILQNIEGKGYFDNFNIAKTYFNIRDYMNSIEYLKRAKIYQETGELYDLVSKNYALLNDRSMQADALERLLEIDNTSSNNIKYALALGCMQPASNAFDFLKNLINSNPDMYEYKYIYYEMLIAEREINIAREYVNSLYSNNSKGGDLYIYLKHLLTNGRRSNIEKARRIIFSASTKVPQNNYISISKALYYATSNKYNDALKILNALASNDYFIKTESNIIKSFIYIQLKDYKKARFFAKAIPSYRYDWFLHNFVINWNLKDFVSLFDVVRDARYSCINEKKVKNVGFSVLPNIYDFDLSFTFDGHIDDIVETILYPIFIDPDEVVEILKFGIRSLTEQNAILALKALTKTVEFNDALKLNNNAVASTINGNYYSAIEDIKAADAKLPSNPIILYNMGLLCMLTGDRDKALACFESSISSNRYFFPALVAKAVIYSKDGRSSEAKNIASGILGSFDSSWQDIKSLPMYIKNTKYMSQLLLEMYDNLLVDVSDINDNQFNKFIYAIATYMKGSKEQAFNMLKMIKTYNSSRLFNYLTLFNNKSDLIPVSVNDKSYQFTANFIKSRNNKPLLSINVDLNNKYELKEAAYYDILSGRRDVAFNRLARLSRIAFDFPPLYALSLYYFMWVSDDVNMAGANASLRQLRWSNLYSMYYSIIYRVFSRNYNRLTADLNDYKQKYPDSEKSYLASALYMFLKSDLAGLENDIAYLTSHFELLNKKVSTVINIESL